MKRILLILTILLATFSASAQEDPDLIAIAVDTTYHQLILIDSGGGDTFVDFPAPMGAFMGGRTMTVSQDTSLVAYCWGIGNGVNNNYHLSVMEISTGEMLLDRDFGNILDCQAGEFSPDGTQVAVARVNTAPAYGNATKAEWALEIYDVASGEVVSELGPRDEIATALSGFGEEVSVLADVQHFTDETVSFAAIPYVGMGGIDNVPAFAWNLTDNTLTQHDSIGRLSGDHLYATNETVYPAYNSDLAAAVPEGPRPLANEVRVIDDQGERVIYQNEDWVIAQTFFIADGESIAVVLLANAENPDQQAQRIDIIHRDGSVIELPQGYDNFTQVGNAEGGGVVLWADFPEGSSPPTNHLSLIQPDDTVEEIWSYKAETDDMGYSFYELVWARPMPDEGDFPPFVAIQ